MIDLSTTYMGLNLKNPIIAGSSGLTDSVEKIKALETHGAGAVVLKSLFEEQIRYYIETEASLKDGDAYKEAEEYIRNLSEHPQVGKYLDLIREAKNAIGIPVIASINCVSAFEWLAFARKLEEAGADALELNIFISPSDPLHSSEQNENLYFEIIHSVIRNMHIPVAVKISPYFTCLTNAALKLSWSGISGLVLFNRFYSPDLDTESLTLVPANVFSRPDEIYHTLRWVALLSNRVMCDLSATTGIHDGTGLIKVLLAGARVAQVTSTLYLNGLGRIGEMLKELEQWMDRHHYGKIDDFRGIMSLKKIENPAAWERIQFMKHFAGIE